MSSYNFASRHFLKCHFAMEQEEILTTPVLVLYSSNKNFLASQ